MELHRVFPSFNFTEIIPTTSGIIDTTYIVHTKERGYILKRYEREIPTKIIQDAKRLEELKSAGLNVSTLIKQSEGLYLYTKLAGDVPSHVKAHHIQALARFMATLHQQSYKKSCASTFINEYDINAMLKFTKSKQFFYYKKLQELSNLEIKNDGFIHGDIFKDNTVFENSKIGVFDFIDGGCGSFYFDAAVALVGFDIPKHKEFFLNLFLGAYNQKAPKKLKKEELLKNIESASNFYALLRIDKYKNTTKAKELIR